MRGQKMIVQRLGRPRSWCWIKCRHSCMSSISRSARPNRSRNRSPRRAQVHGRKWKRRSQARDRAGWEDGEGNWRREKLRHPTWGTILRGAATCNCKHCAGSDQIIQKLHREVPLALCRCCLWKALQRADQAQINISKILRPSATADAAPRDDGALLFPEP